MDHTPKRTKIGLLKRIRKLFPEMPRHVFRELVLHNVTGYLYPICSNKRWSLEVRHITIDSFDDETQKRMRARDFGNKNPDNIEDDEERMEWQRKNCRPGVNEPVVVIEAPDGRLDLLEGWHRTMALLTINTPQDPVAVQMWIGKSMSDNLPHDTMDS